MANEIKNAIDNAFRDFQAAGIPSSGKHNVQKGEVRSAGTVIQAAIEGAAAGLVRAATLEELPDGTREGQPGEVTEGADKGAYSWDGSAWVRVGDLIDAGAIEALSTDFVNLEDDFETAKLEAIQAAGLWQDDDAPQFEILTSDGRRAMAADSYANPIFTAIPRLYLTDEDDEDEALFTFVDEEFRPINPSNADAVTAIAPGVLEADPPARLWSEAGFIRQAPAFDALYDAEPNSVIDTAAQVYGLYDDLVDEFPDYVSRQDVGLSSDGSPIYAYTFGSAGQYIINTTWTDDEVALPKLIITGGVHGNERPAIRATYLFARNICQSWIGRGEYEYLRWSAQIIILPCCNPSGVTLKTRRNSAGVDLNRNFDADWTFNPDTESDQYAGPSVASEVETQALSAFITANTDACGLIDHHNGSFLEPLWLGTEGAVGLAICGQVAADMAAWVRREVNPETSDLPVRISINGVGTLARYAQNLSIPMILLETYGHAGNPSLDGTYRTHTIHCETALLKLASAFVKRAWRSRETSSSI